MTSSMSSERDEQAVDQVQPVGLLVAAELRPAAYDVVAVLQEDLEQLLEAQGARLPVDQADVVDAEGLLHRGLLVELLEDRLGDEAVLDLDDQAHAVGHVGQVLDVGDAQELLALDEHLDPLDDLLQPDGVRHLGDHDALAPPDRLDAGGRPHPEAATAGLVGVADAVETDDLAAGRQVGPRDEPHQPVGVGVGVRDQVAQRLDHLDQVVRRHVGGHADRDAGAAVDHEVGDRRREDDGLELPAVVVGLEVDGVLVDRGRHRHRCRRHPALGVAHGRRGVVAAGRPEVAVPVDHGQPQRPGLGHADQGVVDRAVTVGVQPAHHLADDAGALDVPAVGEEPHLVHRVQDPALHGLEAVAGVGEGAGVDDRVGVLQERRAHLVAHVDVEDVLLEVVGEVLLGGSPCHRPILSRRSLPSRAGTPLTARQPTRRDSPSPLAGP